MANFSGGSFVFISCGIFLFDLFGSHLVRFSFASYTKCLGPVTSYGLFGVLLRFFDRDLRTVPRTFIVGFVFDCTFTNFGNTVAE